MDILPELLNEIVSHLNVKDIIRLRSSCKNTGISGEMISYVDQFCTHLKNQSLKKIAKLIISTRRVIDVNYIMNENLEPEELDRFARHVYFYSKDNSLTQLDDRTQQIIDMKYKIITGSDLSETDKNFCKQVTGCGCSTDLSLLHAAIAIGDNKLYKYLNPRCGIHATTIKRMIRYNQINFLNITTFVDYNIEDFCAWCKKYDRRNILEILMNYDTDNRHEQLYSCARLVRVYLKGILIPTIETKHEYIRFFKKLSEEEFFHLISKIDDKVYRMNIDRSKKISAMTNEQIISTYMGC